MRFVQIQEKLRSARVGIAGAGGLGSNCAVALVRSGVGNLVIADFDVITESNLNRQAYFRDQVGMKKVVALKENLLRISPALKLEMFDGCVNPQNIQALFGTCDIIVEAFDLAEMKEMLITEVNLQLPDTPLVCGLGLAGYGDIDMLTVRRFNHLIICGDGKREVSEEMPPLAPRVGIVSHMQADLVLEYLLNV